MSKLFKAYEKGSDGQFGLGLAIVHKVVTAYGFVPAAFNVDRGVIFKITQKRTKKVSKK
jgi:two-component system, OmpR family, sensor histidine kinase CssS